MSTLPSQLLEIAEYPTQKALADHLSVSYTYVRRVFANGYIRPDVLHQWTQEIYAATGIEITIGLWADGEISLVREDK